MYKRKRSKIGEADKSSNSNLILMKRKVLLLSKQRNSCKMAKKVVNHPESKRMRQLEELN